MGKSMSKPLCSLAPPSSRLHLSCVWGSCHRQAMYSTFISLGFISSGSVPCTLACVAALPQGCVQCAIVKYMLQHILHPYAADKRAFVARAACGHDAGAARGPPAGHCAFIAGHCAASQAPLDARVLLRHDHKHQISVLSFAHRPFAACPPSGPRHAVGKPVGAPGHRPPHQLRHLDSLGRDWGTSGVLGRVQGSHHPADHLQGVPLPHHLGRPHTRRPEAPGASPTVWLLMQACHDAILVRLGQVCTWHCSFVLLLCSKGAVSALRQGCCVRAGSEGGD